MNRLAKTTLSVMLVALVAYSGYTYYVNSKHNVSVQPTEPVVSVQPESMIPDKPVVNAAEAEADDRFEKELVKNKASTKARVETVSQTPAKRIGEKTKRVINKAIDATTDAIDNTINTIKSAKCTGNDEWKSGKDCNWVRSTWGTGGTIGPWSEPVPEGMLGGSRR